MNPPIYENCPANINDLRNQPRIVGNGDKIYVNSIYARCDKGGTYCTFKIKNQTAEKCATECFFMNYRYAGTMQEYSDSTFYFEAIYLELIFLN